MAWSSYRDLIVWQKSMALTGDIYKITDADLRTTENAFG